jgi:hypothetical protein
MMQTARTPRREVLSRFALVARKSGSGFAPSGLHLTQRKATRCRSCRATAAAPRRRVACRAGAGRRPCLSAHKRRRAEGAGAIEDGLGGSLAPARRGFSV